MHGVRYMCANDSPSFSRNWTPIPLPNVGEKEMSERSLRTFPLDTHRHIFRKETNNTKEYWLKII